MNSTKNCYHSSFLTHSSMEETNIEITEWLNGEGVDIEVDAPHNLGCRVVRLTWQEFDEIVGLVGSSQ